MSTPYGPQGPQQPVPPYGGPQPQGPQFGPPPGQQFGPQYGPPNGYAPQPAYGYGMPAPAPEPRNGFGIAALICAILGLLCAIMPILFLVGGPLSVIAIGLAFAGRARVTRGTATNKGTNTAALIIGILALLAAINGARIVFTAVNEFGNQVQHISNDNQKTIDCIGKATTPEEMSNCVN
ncbi:hypothetical protein GCM10009530_63880 [Microbispora corallina]|uniref:DUF4190 domain-containing protein n=1 Tax=Microbispora corallina TaxID=83302 RepID=A0ABQ4GC03_9ACTN|nr:DUF4190 domain-containing protein [Microbispora corallina]GIH44611.1 hypothetical protein Mco01_76110 [Microbispora corallina]